MASPRTLYNHTQHYLFRSVLLNILNTQWSIPYIGSILVFNILTYTATCNVLIIAVSRLTCKNPYTCVFILIKVLLSHAIPWIETDISLFLLKFCCVIQHYTYTPSYLYSLSGVDVSHNTAIVRNMYLFFSSVDVQDNKHAVIRTMRANKVDWLQQHLPTGGQRIRVLLRYDRLWQSVRNFNNVFI